ncbi:Protein of unknown function [Lactobacillus hominis]|uniref:Uncharacterized protein n=1 Tax=Lactobacillus hominis DSM 23910 = CRBIP 24.179 TaxID=1423758 RepID=I7L5U2_9LACO|nr:Protein of unknown function [Lactobacillus hominis]KRM85839.1 hypothetical protein FC41_GL000025 [Lactobacillus hominis DSM 23910 = CRBIP 24.179]CCI81617.1 Protein of unknown function [Lactobacillus hominis DSM 23910 = CRBIP 24.179]
MVLSENEMIKRHRKSNSKWNSGINERAEAGDPEAIAYRAKRRYNQKFSTAKTFINKVGKTEDIKELKGLIDKRLKHEQK